MTDQPTDQPATASPLRNCPACDCPLDEAESPHRCPGCGLAYDEHSCEWACMPPSGRLQIGLMGVLAFLSCATMIAAWGFGGSAQIVLVLFLMAEGVAFLLMRRWKQMRPSSVAVLPDGIHIKSADDDLFVVWPAVRGVEIVRERLYHGLRLYRHTCGAIVSVDLGRLSGSPESDEHFVQVVENGIQRYATLAEKSSPTEPNHASEAPSGSLPRLRACPVCAYPLEGLPQRHRCPECGLEYDEHSCVWASPPLSGLRGWLYLLLAPLFCAFASILVWEDVWRNPTLSHVGGLVLWLFAGTVPTLWVWRTRTRPLWIATLPSGIHIQDFVWPVIVPWTAARAVEISHARNEVYLSYRKRWGTKTTPLARFLQTSTAREQFARAVEEGRRRYAPRVEEAPEHE
jgi:hypothetical protein